jgi:hypothetical protein
MNQVDRFQALIRHPDYRNDTRRADRLKFDPFYGGLSRLFPRELTPSAAKAWCHRKTNYCDFIRVWGIAHPVDPENPKEISEALKALRSGDGSIFSNDFRVYETSELNGKPDQSTERHLTISVDLGRPTDELQQLFRTIVNRRRKEQDIKKNANRGFNAGPWKVWDEYQTNGNNLLKVARDLFGVKKNPTNDDRAMQVYRKVQRAHLEAVAMIEEVGRRRKVAATEQDRLFQALDLLTRAQFSGAIPEWPRPAWLDDFLASHPRP